MCNLQTSNFFLIVRHPPFYLDGDQMYETKLHHRSENIDFARFECLNPNDVPKKV